MAGWLKIAARSFVVAAGAGAAQLGVAQALSVLVWSTVPTPEVWRRQLMWLLFIFAASVLVGVAGGRRSVRAVRQAITNRRAEAAAARHSGLVPHQSGLRAAQRRALASAKHKTVDTARGIAAAASRVSATLFAALGAWAAFALVWLPARHTYAAPDMRVLALAALIGIAVGSVISLLSLVAAPIAANAAVTVAGVWIFALASVAVAVARDTPTPTPRLAVLDAPDLISPDEWWFGPNLMVVVAALFGFAVAATARWVGAPRLAIALSGLAGPAIVAAAYLLVGPAEELMSGYVAALVAATVGLLTSAAVAATQRLEIKPAPPPAALTQGPAAVPYAPRAIESVPAAAAPRPAQAMPTAGAAYPTPHPASLYPAAQPPAPAVARAYSANPYPTNQYPTMAGWSEAARAASSSTVDNPVYHAPARSAPVPPPPVTPPAPRAKPVPAARPAPALKPPVAPTVPTPPPPPLPEPFAAPPRQSAPRPAQLAPAPTPRGTANQPPGSPLVFPPAPYAAPTQPTTPPPPPARAAKPAAPVPTPAAAPPPARPTKSAPVPPPAPAAAAAAAAAAAQAATAPAAATAATGSASGKGRAKAKGKATPPAQPTAPPTTAGAQPATASAQADPAPTMLPAPPPTGRKTRHRGRADQTVRVYEPVKAEPVRKAKGDLPRTTRPAEVVAVEATRPKPEAEPGAIRGRRARRRAAKLARERAEWEARQAKLREEDAKNMGKREREHVDWVQRLVSLPDDPSLITRQK